MNTPNIFDVVTIFFQNTFKIVVSVCQAFGNGFTGQVQESACPLIHKGDVITFGNKMIVKE